MLNFLTQTKEEDEFKKLESSLLDIP
jgi:hypothetical protein